MSEKVNKGKASSINSTYPHGNNLTSRDRQEKPEEGTHQRERQSTVGMEKEIDSQLRRAYVIKELMSSLANTKP